MKLANRPEGDSLGQFPTGKLPVIESRQEFQPAVDDDDSVIAGDKSVLGLSLVGQDPCANYRSPKYTMGSRRKTGSILAPSSGDPKDRSSDGVEPGHTILDRRIDRRVCMLLSFQRPPHRLEKFVLFGVRPVRLGRV